ncbi:MAG: hypothetical protein WBO88_07385 [Candidatus Dechloromonas phosphoritropha]
MSDQHDCGATALYKPRMPTLAAAICLAFAALSIAAQAQVGELILPTLGGTNSTAIAVSADGAVVVGSANPAGNTAQHAFRWTSAGMADLGTLGGTYSFASAVSADGAVVVGSADPAGNVAPHAFRWTSAGMVDLGTLGGNYSYGEAVSAVTGNYAASSAPTSATRTTASAAGSERTVLSGPVA